MREQANAVGPGEEFLLLLRGEAREHEVPGRARLVDGDDDAPAGAGERPGALDRLAEHGVEVEARVDPQDGVAKRRAARPRGLLVSPGVFRMRHGFSLAESARSARQKAAHFAVEPAAARRISPIFTIIIPKQGKFARTFYTALCTFR